jgi:hypothetical protein
VAHEAKVSATREREGLKMSWDQLQQQWVGVQQNRQSMASRATYLEQHSNSVSLMQHQIQKEKQVPLLVPLQLLQLLLALLLLLLAAAPSAVAVATALAACAAMVTAATAAEGCRGRRQQ